MYLYLITLLTGNMCAVILPPTDNINVLSNYQQIISTVDVYSDDVISDVLIDKLFPVIYNIKLDNITTIVQCEK